MLNKVKICFDYTWRNMVVTNVPNSPWKSINNTFIIFD